MEQNNYYNYNQEQNNNKLKLELDLELDNKKLELESNNELDYYQQELEKIHFEENNEYDSNMRLPSTSIGDDDYLTYNSTTNIINIDIEEPNNCYHCYPITNNKIIILVFSFLFIMITILIYFT